MIGSGAGAAAENFENPGAAAKKSRFPDNSAYMSLLTNFLFWAKRWR